MTRYHIGVILPQQTPETEIKETIKKMMEPYKDVTVEPYRVYLTARDIKAVRLESHKPRAAQAKLVAAVAAYFNAEAGFDEQGLYYIYNRNPKRKFDWYVVGGVYNGYAIDCPRSDNENGYNNAPEFETLAENMIKIGNIDFDFLCYALVLPTGEWIERDDSWNSELSLAENDAINEAELQVWKKDLLTLLQEHRNHYIVGLETHM